MKGFVRLLLRAIGAGLASVLGGIRLEGTKNVPRRGALMIVSNHLCDIDAPILWLCLPRPAWFMAMAELFEMRFIGPFIAYVGAFPIHRDSADRAAIRLSEEKLKAGDALVIFPEGRGNPEGVLGVFQPGAAMIALRTGATIQPVGLIGMHRILPYGTSRPCRSSEPVRVRFGQPFTLDDLKSLPRHEAMEKATQRMRDAVGALIGEPTD